VVRWAAAIIAGGLMAVALSACGSSDAVRGEQIVIDYGCLVCHEPSGQSSLGPSLVGIWGQTASFEDGGTALVDADYVAESVLDPTAAVVRGYAPTMPTFFLTDEELSLVAAYVRSLGTGD